jgi:recombinational DNA repair protein RecT
MKKITKRENFTNIQNILTQYGYNDLAEVMAHEIELLDKKSSNKDKGPTKTQVENGNLKTAILNYMDPTAIYTISDLQSLVPELRDKTNQKVNSLVTQLKNDNLVIRTYVKRVAYFQKVGE